MSEQPDNAGASEVASPWTVEQEPTTLMVLWPDDRAPTQTEILSLLNDVLEAPVEVLDELDADDPRIRWNAVLETPLLTAPIIVWTEPAQPPSPDELDDARAAACHWVLGAQTMLPADDPLTGFASLMRLLAAAFTESPAIADVNTMRWHPRAALERTFLATPHVEPPADVLWTIHLVNADRARSRDVSTWLHTHGLWRCGLPELEMLEVDPACRHTAAAVLDSVAGLMLETGPPAPGEPYYIGNELAVAFQPWEEIVPHLNEGAAGGRTDREGDDVLDAHTGVRAVVCGTQPRGRYRKLWMWPEQVVRRIRDDEAVVFMSGRQTQRQAAAARNTWAELATAFAAMSGRAAGGHPSVVLLKAAFAAGDDERDGAEHLWFEISRFAGDRAEGKLLNQPLAVPELHEGDVLWIDRASVSDWFVFAGGDRFGPDDIEPLWTTIDALEPNGAAR